MDNNYIQKVYTGLNIINPIDFDWSDFDQTKIEVPTTGSHIGWGCPIQPIINSLGLGEAYLWLGWINYFIPLHEFAGMMTMWLLAIAVYYPSSIALRWARVIS